MITLIFKGQKHPVKFNLSNFDREKKLCETVEALKNSGAKIKITNTLQDTFGFFPSQVESCIFTESEYVIGKVMSGPIRLNIPEKEQEASDKWNKYRDYVRRSR